MEQNAFLSLQHCKLKDGGVKRSKRDFTESVERPGLRPLNGNRVFGCCSENQSGGRRFARGKLPQRVDERSASKNKSEQKDRPLAWQKTRSRRRTQRANYYTNRKVLTLPIINLDVRLDQDLEENLRIAISHLQVKGGHKKVLVGEKKQAVKNLPRQKTEAEIERLKRKTMEGKSGNNSGQGKFSKNDDHQSVAVNVRERKFPDDKKRVCSSAECKTFLGEANRNRKSKDLANIEKAGGLKPETTQKYLQDSYNNAFQRHVDNLTNVISQHRNSTAPDKPKTEVHIHPTENSKNQRNATPKPLSKLEIKNEAGINQRITFAHEEDNEEEFEDFNKMNQTTNLRKINQFVEGPEEEDLFEELIEPHPMITFNHVCSEAESDQVNFNQIKSGSRSCSPMLEVPNSKSTCQKMASRPPL